MTVKENKKKSIWMVKNSTKGQALKSFCFISGVWKHSHTKRAYDGCQIDK